MRSVPYRRKKPQKLPGFRERNSSCLLPNSECLLFSILPTISSENSMKPREVVLNASPLICLSKSGLSGLLPALFEHSVVPGAVADELLTKGSADAEIE